VPPPGQVRYNGRDPSTFDLERTAAFVDQVGRFEWRAQARHALTGSSALLSLCCWSRRVPSCLDSNPPTQCFKCLKLFSPTSFHLPPAVRRAHAAADGARDAAVCAALHVGLGLQEHDGGGVGEGGAIVCIWVPI